MEAAASAPARLMPGQRAAFLPPRAAESYRRLFGDLRSECSRGLIEPRSHNASKKIPMISNILCFDKMGGY